MASKIEIKYSEIGYKIDMKYISTSTTGLTLLLSLNEIIDINLTLKTLLTKKCENIFYNRI